MITDEIVDAMDMLIGLMTGKNKKAGATAIREMLCDFSNEEWNPMNEEERQEWLKRFLN